MYVHETTGGKQPNKGDGLGVRVMGMDVARLIRRGRWG